MKKMFLSAFAVAALAFVGCTEDATNDLVQDNNGGAAVELHEITFEAEIDQPTRTSLADPGTGTSYVCWDADDVVGVICDDGKIYQATVKTGAGSPNATYSASLPEGLVPVAAFYPYQFPRDQKSTVAFDGSDNISISVPELQTYRAGSVFGDDENVMVGVFEEAVNGPKCAFKSVMGAIELKFKGSQKVYGVTVKNSNYKQKMSGPGSINLSDKLLTMGTGDTSFSFVALDVPEVVTLNPATTTSFYVLVPAGTYTGLQIGVLTEDGSYSRFATKDHTVKAGEILPINCGNLDTMIDEGAAVNLSANDFANCYHYTAGAEKTYVFDTKMVDGTPLHTKVYDFLKARYITGTGDSNAPGYPDLCTEEDIKAHYAQVLWTEDTRVAYDVQFDKANGKIYFKGGANAGNARIILGANPIKIHTLSGKVLRPDTHFIWGWHIWSTLDTPQVSITTHPYQAGTSEKVGNTTTYYASREQIIARSKSTPTGFMDRNLGATWTPKSVSDVNNITLQQATDALGLYYQAGNIAPYPRTKEFGVGGSADGAWDEWQRTTYQYGFAQFAQSWVSSGAAKTTIEETLQHPYHRYSKKTVSGDDFSPIDGYYGSTQRNSWVLTDISLGCKTYNQNNNTAKQDRVAYTGPVLWDGATNNKLATKGNFDPCPQGWKVAHRGNVYQFAIGQGFQFMETGATAYTSASQKTFQTVASKKFNNVAAGVYVCYDGSNVDFWPFGGYAGAKITFNGSGYYWAAQYYNQDPAHTSAAVKMILPTSKSNSVDYNWPQTSSPYQIRCVKGN